MTPSMKAIVAARVGLTTAKIVRAGDGPCCEYDHLIPRELGGADDVDNLQAQPWAEAHVKDLDENRLHKAVCAGTITLAAAQDEMRHWHP